MFPTRYFPDRYFAPRYFPKVGAGSGATPATPGEIRLACSRRQVFHIPPRPQVLTTLGRSQVFEPAAR